MASLAEIDAELAKRQSITRIDAELNQRSGVTDKILEVVEPTIALGTAGLAAIPAGLAGISQTLNPFAEEGAGERIISQVQEALTIQPKTEAGKRGLERTTELLQPIADIIDKFRTGEETLESGGGTLLATINEIAPEILGAMFGLKGVGGRTDLPEVKTTPGGALVPALDKTGQIKSDLLNNPQKSTTAGFKLSKGEVVADPAGKAALAQNWANEIVSGVKAANEATKTQVRKMVDLSHKRLTGSAEDKIRLRPSNVLGDSLFKRFKFVEQANKAAGKLLNRIAENQGSSPVDISGPLQWFNGKLNEFGIVIKDGKADFSQSSLPKSDFAMIRENIGQINRILKGNVSFFEAHKLKQIIRRTGLSFEQTVTKKGASPEAQNIFKGLSSRIDEILDNKSKAYDDANIKFGETKEVIDGFGKVIKNRLFTESASESMGKLMRRLTSNAESREVIKDLIDNTDVVAKKYGGKFDDDLFLQQSVVNDMDKVISVAAPTSIRGELGPQAVAESLQRSTAGNVANVLRRVSKITGIKSERKALDALRALTN
ncbi:MAG: hypothetical protein O7D95_02880 [Betaproteobacteria bacterium]|nr:hypothetical protein [Betaproteobacteria bacterium]